MNGTDGVVNESVNDASEAKSCFAIKVYSAHVGKGARGWKPEHWLFIWAEDLQEAIENTRHLRGWKRNKPVSVAFKLSKSQEADILAIATMIEGLKISEIVRRGFISRRKMENEMFVEPLIDNIMMRAQAERHL